MANAPDATTRERLAETTAKTRDTLGDHLRHEETEALPLVQRLLPEEGWQKGEKAAGDGNGVRALPFLATWAAR
jgi:hypothetical protein